MAANNIENLPGWIRHEGGEAYNSFCEFVWTFASYCDPETDDPSDVCRRLTRMPDAWLNRLDPAFVGLEREADPDRYFRLKYMKLHDQYVQSMQSAMLLSGGDDKKMYRDCARVVQAYVPRFTEFFDDLRKFISLAACSGGYWSNGDSKREDWDMKVFERKVVWG